MGEIMSATFFGHKVEDEGVEMKDIVVPTLLELEWGWMKGTTSPEQRNRDKVASRTKKNGGYTLWER